MHGQQESSSTGPQQAPQARDILDAIREIWRRGNASRLDIEKDGKTFVSIALTVGAIGLILAPVAALIGIGAAIVREYQVRIVLDDGTIVDVNAFAVRRATEKKTGSGTTEDPAEDRTDPPQSDAPIG